VLQKQLEFAVTLQQVEVRHSEVMQFWGGFKMHHGCFG
jgi:hypothetical protein